MNEDTSPGSRDSEKAKTKWFQLSIRGMFLLTLLSGIWLTIWTLRAKEQKRIVDWVTENGGVVMYENGLTLDVEGETVFGFTSWDPIVEEYPTWKWIPLPPAWKTWMGPDFEWNVETIWLERFGPDELSPIAGLTGLKELYYYEPDRVSEEIEKLKLALPNCKFIPIDPIIF